VNQVRTRNPRGQGARLRDEIVDAAMALLEESGREESITLRAVARRAGITAPSIYAHFEDRDAILAAVIDAAFYELIDALTAAIDGIEDPVERLHTGCHAYLGFAVERPHRYRVMFGRDRDPESAIVAPAVPAGKLTGLEAFQILVDSIRGCAEAGRSDSVDPFADAAVLWSAMHGFAGLQQSLEHFPWPDRVQMEHAIIDRLARVRD
jgi:AcrR family transcriptional regulator